MAMASISLVRLIPKKKPRGASSLCIRPGWSGKDLIAVEIYTETWQGSYVGASSFAAWEDSTGSNRRMLEVRNAKYAPSMDNAVLLRTAVNNSWYAYRLVHAGMATPIPVANGGTGAANAKTALTNLGIFYADTLPSSGTDGQICLVPV